MVMESAEPIDAVPETTAVVTSPRCFIAASTLALAWIQQTRMGGEARWRAYVDAGFNNVQVSDRGPDRCAPGSLQPLQG